MAIGVHFLIFLAIVFNFFGVVQTIGGITILMPQALLLAWHDFNFNPR